MPGAARRPWSGNTMYIGVDPARLKINQAPPGSFIFTRSSLASATVATMQTMQTMPGDAPRRD